MQHHWLNKQNNKNLIIFFAGWSFDYKPFEFLECNDYDVLMFYDYNEKTLMPSLLKEIKNHTEITLIAWSMGVYTAYSLCEIMPEFKNKIAINGTPYPVHDEWGIPQKPFLLTLRHAKTGLEGKFYQNIFQEEAEFENYTKTPVERPVENRVNELKSIYEQINTENSDYKDFYDFAIVSLNDKIIPSKNQLNFWNRHTKVKTLESGHFPFYNFKSWDELIKCK